MSSETMNTTQFDYTKSQSLFDRAKNVIPGGIYGHFNPMNHVPAGTYPNYVARAEGARFWDVDGNEFIDYMCAYGPMILGYGNSVVNEAFQKQAAEADTCTLASPVMIELAEYMVDLIPVADWAYFAKNGADVTNLAVMIARASTGRNKVIAIADGYHGSTPWMQAAGREGTIESDRANVIRIPWNDPAALESELSKHSGDVAAFISSPYHHPAFKDNEMPDPGYWNSIHETLRRHGVVSILDDVRAGFRIDMGGSNEYFGYKPDLICYCKAIGNGYPISALVGVDALKDAASKVFHTGSFWYSAGPMAAALACLKELKRIDAPQLINETGTKVFDGLVAIAADHGHELKVTGVPSMPYIRTLHEEGHSFHQRLCGECTRRGLFLTSHHNLFVSAAHTEEDVQRTFDIFEDALNALT
jgi:glutamate-1-semialdehyde 2,1-aminomutase